MSRKKPVHPVFEVGGDQGLYIANLMIYNIQV